MTPSALQAATRGLSLARTDHADLEYVACISCGGDRPVALLRSRVQMSDDSREVFSWVGCGECGQVYLNPRVPAGRVGEYYRNYVPHRGSGAWGRWSWLVDYDQRRLDRARLRTVRRTGRLDASTRVLDFGCGRPTFLAGLRRASGAAATGVDFDADGWTVPTAMWNGLSLHVGELEAIEGLGPFDVITMWHALEHLYHPVESLRRLRAMAAPGARLIIEVPDYDSMTRRRQGSYWAGYHTPRHTAAYTPGTLRQIVERSGWVVRDQYQWGTLHPYIVYWLGRQERAGRNWRGTLQHRMLPFIAGRMATLPISMLRRWMPLGVQTLIATT
jgi:2-polyprenyl-3-methyl-5-hydroxy-6-metoxy-1,4-benzoquinol methylase